MPIFPQKSALSNATMIECVQVNPVREHPAKLIRKKHAQPREATIISRMSHHLWTQGGVGTVVLTVWVLAGSLAARDWRPFQRRPLRSQTTRNQPAAEFDPEAACDEVVRAHNRIRAEAKLPPLAISSKLQAAAERHAKDMAAHDKMTHKGSDGSSPIDRIKADGISATAAPAKTSPPAASRPRRLMKGWMDSPHHKREHPRQLFPDRRGLRDR